MGIYAVPFDPATRKTVSCSELDDAFKQNPHPDGKTMQAFAEKLGLNKKQVSNYFERERRKAGIIIPSRRLNDHPAKETVLSSAHFGSMQSSDLHRTHAVTDPDPRSSQTAIYEKLPYGTAAHPCTSYQHSGSASTKPEGCRAGVSSSGNPPIAPVTANSLLLPTTRPPKRVTSLKPTIIEVDKDYSSEPDRQHESEEDEYCDDADGDADYNERQDIEEEKAFITQSQSLRHTVPTVSINASSTPAVAAAALPSQRNNCDWPPEGAVARSWSHWPKSRLSPRYASAIPVPPSQQDHFAMACSAPTIDRLSSSSSPLGSTSDLHRVAYSSSTGLRAGYACATTSLRAPDLKFAYSSSVTSSSPPAPHHQPVGNQDVSNLDPSSTSYFTSPPGGVGSESQRVPKKSRPDTSSTLLFLRNPFPQHVLLPSCDTDEASSRGIFEHDEPVRKRARTYFIRSPSPPKLSVVTSSSEASRRRGEKFEKIRHFATASAPSSAGVDSRSSPSSSVVAAGLVTGPITRTVAVAAFTGTVAGQEPFEDEEEEEEESDYDEDEDHAALKLKRAQQAALRTTIACDELKQAFLSNPHPPTQVLDQLAIRLGLGKKQVSNYFVRERKKTGYQIKVRHGLQRRKGKKKSAIDDHSNNIENHGRSSAPSYNSYPPATHADDDDEDDEYTMNTSEEQYDNDQVYVNNKRRMVGKARPPCGAYPAIIVDNASDDGRDDVPELSYDDLASLRSEQMTHTDSMSSLLMLAANSQDVSRATAVPPSSTGDDESEEFASPPYFIAALAPQSFDQLKPIRQSYQTLHPRIA